MGCKKCMGLKAGERVERLGLIRVLDVRREPLNAIDDADTAREGFPDWSYNDFISMYCAHNGGKPDQEVTRIEYEYF